MIASYTANTQKGIIVAMDGPSASGKETISQELVAKLGGVQFYTGGMYRALTLKCKNIGVDLKDEENILKTLSTSDIRIEENGKGNFSKVILDGIDVTYEITSPEISIGVPFVSQFEKVREVMVNRQRQIAQKEISKGKLVIMEGRDIGTKVLPNADIKIFLTASVDIRARRRLEQYKEKGVKKELFEVIKETEDRDHQDSNRKVDPLVKDPENYGYFVLDNSNLTIGETVNKIIDLITSSLDLSPGL